MNKLNQMAVQYHQKTLVLFSLKKYVVHLKSKVKYL